MQTQNITTARKIRAFPWLYAGEAANSVFVILTWFGPVLPLFLNALGLTKTRIGLILAISFFCAPFSLLVSRWVLRWGVKKTFLWGFGIRALATAGLCAAPTVLRLAGVSAVFSWIVVIALAASIWRAIGETGFMPWSREIIPDHLRGKVIATAFAVSGLAALLAALLAAVVLKYISGLHGYSLLALLSLPFGVVSIFLYGLIPGGQPIQVAPAPRAFIRDYLQVLKDRNFLTYELGRSLFSLAVAAFAFLPLFLKGPVGLGADKILVLSACACGGLLASAFLWGWSADRFGSKPVLLASLLLLSLMPLLLFGLPRASAGSMSMAVMAYVYLGIATNGLNIGDNRYFYVGVIPADNRNQAYYSIHYTLAGLSLALGPLLTGPLLDWSEGFGLGWRGLHLDQFTPLFTLSLLILLTAFYVLGRLRKDGAARPGEFMAMFVQGNPFMAFHSMIRYRFADDEAERLSTTRRLGDARNPMSVAELLEAITDPSFNVRYEAILAMARMRAHPQLTQALIAVLDSKEPDLSVVAGWALGRLGAKQAVPALRRALTSEYALLRSRSARSLAALGDTEAVPILLSLFKSEKYDNIRVAYASALGVLRAEQALDDLLELLPRLANENLCSEVALAIAHIMGGEHHFVRLWRATRSDFGTGVAEAVAALRTRWGSELSAHAELGAALDTVELSMSAQDISTGAAALGGLIRQLPLARLEAAQRKVLEACARSLTTTLPVRREYVLLALNGLLAAMPATGDKSRPLT